MKSKAKPAKGSARTKRFDVGGTVGALAGLGTLAYLMSRKKKGAAGAEGSELKSQGKFPSEDGSGTSGPGMDEYKPKVDEMKPKVDDAGRQRALAASMGRPEMGDADSESDKALVRTDGGQTTPVVKKKYAPPPAAKPKTSQSSSTTKDVVTSLKDRGATTLEKGTGTKTEAKPSKYTTPGDPNAKGSTQRGRSENPIQGTIDSATRSTVRTDAEKMRERALEVERRRQEEKAAKLGYGIKNGGAVKKYASGGSVKASSMGSVKQAKPSMSSASKRADGIAQRGKTRGRVC
jgi:hypothetical protein